MARNRISFAEICNSQAPPGFVVDNCINLQYLTIHDATEEVYRHIQARLGDLKRGWQRSVKHLYIGKSHIRKKRDRVFDITNPTTWDKSGIDSRYTDHVKQEYGKNGLIVLATVTECSIPADCVAAKYIIHKEEYALTLEKRLIERFRAERDHRLANMTTETGRTDGNGSEAYVVYIAFTMSEEQCEANGIALLLF